MNRKEDHTTWILSELFALRLWQVETSIAQNLTILKELTISSCCPTSKYYWYMKICRCIHLRGDPITFLLLMYIPVNVKSNAGPDQDWSCDQRTSNDRSPVILKVSTINYIDREKQLQFHCCCSFPELIKSATGFMHWILRNRTCLLKQNWL